MTIPFTERWLLGPGPSRMTARVTRALSAPVIGHLDPVLLGVLDTVRARLARVFRAPEGSLALAVSGTGTSAMETTIANLVDDRARVVVVTNGYFGERLADMASRYGGLVRRVEGAWGRAIDPGLVGRAIADHRATIVAVVHAETSTGVENPVRAIAELARVHDALLVADTVTSLGGMPVDVDAWGIDAAYSAGQKCLGAASGLAPLVFTPRALERRIRCRSFYLDLALLQDYWCGRRYHHTLSSNLAFALAEALAEIEEEGLETRWARHERHHHALVAGLDELGLSLLPPDGERLWTLHTVRVPEAVDEAAVRTALRETWSIEVGAGMGPLAGRVWRVGLMGAGSTPDAMAVLLAAFRAILRT